MKGPCLCGDPYCSSCGPAQGNSRCPNCGKWRADGGCDNPEACNKACREMDQKMAVDEAKLQIDGARYLGAQPPGWALKEIQDNGTDEDKAQYLS